MQIQFSLLLLSLFLSLVSVCFWVSLVSGICLCYLYLCLKPLLICFYLFLFCLLCLSMRLSLSFLPFSPPPSLLLSLLLSPRFFLFPLPGFVLAADARRRGLEPGGNASSTRARVWAAMMLGRMLPMQTTSEQATDSPLFLSRRAVELPVPCSESDS